MAARRVEIPIWEIDGTPSRPHESEGAMANPSDGHRTGNGLLGTTRWSLVRRAAGYLFMCPALFVLPLIDEMWIAAASAAHREFPWRVTARAAGAVPSPQAVADAFAKTQQSGHSFSPVPSRAASST